MAAPTPRSLVDAKLLASLEEAFAKHAGTDQQIDLADLKAALGLRSDFLAKRVLAAFDRDGNGKISYDEFLAGVRRLVFGTPRERLELAFRIYDEDGDGAIGSLELLRMIAIGLGEADVITPESQPPERLADKVLAAADRNGDGRISFAELEAVMASHPELLDRMTRAEAAWIAPSEDLLARVDGKVPAAPRGRWISNHRVEASLFAAWVLTNIGLFAASMANLATMPGTDPLMQLGRAFGSCAALNGALILVPVMRRLLTRARATFLGRIAPIDDAIDIHRWVGHTLFLLAILHSAAFIAAHGSGHSREAFGAFLFMTIRGGTGLALLVVFTVMWVFALARIRRSKRFELFYFTHLLYVVWLVLAIVHAPSFLLWIGVPLVGFVVEQIVRLARRAKPSQALAEPLRSGVVRLTIDRPAGFSFDPADYVFLNIPSIAKHEWHPFTISSAPERPKISIHVRALGNWTAALRRIAETGEADGGARLPVFVDGPYGTPSARIFSSRSVVLIGAGIGVTPFSSILESILLRSGDASAPRPANVHFFWLNRDQYSFEWFVELLRGLEALDREQRIDMHLCMTNGRADASAIGLEIARALMNREGRRDLVTGLRTLTHMGPPDWDVTLGAIAKQHAGQPVDVFFCGPSGLGAKLRPLCRKHGLAYHEERF